MQFLKTNRWYLLGALAIIVIIGGAYSYYRIPGVVPDLTQFQSGNFSFVYPRAYETREYASGVVSVGDTVTDMFIPLVDVVRYKSDPDRATPPSFEAFVERQAASLCGSDAAGTSVSCATPAVEPYTTEGGMKGEKLSLTLTERNLKTGTTSTLSYAPIYVFDTTEPATAEDPLRYQAIFVYPIFSSFILTGTTSPEFVESIAATLKTDK